MIALFKGDACRVNLFPQTTLRPSTSPTHLSAPPPVLYRPQDSPCPTPRDSKHGMDMFEGFSYTAPSFLAEAMEANGATLQHMTSIPE